MSEATEICNYEAIVIGVSAGGLEALSALVPALPESFALPIIICQHIREDADGYLIEHLSQRCKLSVAEAEEKEQIRKSVVYLAPPGYHLLVENDQTFSLSVDSKVNHVRPSVDVLFESAADTYGKSLIGIILTGANSDGSNGLKRIKDRGGLTIVQDPNTAYASTMPKAAIKNTEVDHILPLNEIAPFLSKLV